MFTPILTNLGLTPEAAQIYESLLKTGPQTAAEIAKSTRVKRTYVYAVSEELLKKGLITPEKQGRTTIFAAQSPDKLLELAEAQKLAVEQSQKALENVLPALKSQYSLSEQKPVVSYYEGVEGVKKAYLDSVAQKLEILAYVQYEAKKNSTNHQLEKFWSKYFKLRVENNIFARVLAPDTPQAREYHKQDKQQLRQTILLPDLSFPPDFEKNIIGNKIYFFSRSENNPIATVLENKPIADTERTIFETLWKNHS